MEVKEYAVKTKITSAEELAGELYCRLYQHFQLELDDGLYNLIEDYDGEDTDDYAEMLEGFMESIEPDIVVK